MDLVHGGSTIQDAFGTSGLTLTEFWLQYIAIGGSSPMPVVRAYLVGETGVAPIEHDAMAQTLNEFFMADGLDHPVPFADEL